MAAGRSLFLVVGHGSLPQIPTPTVALWRRAAAVVHAQAKKTPVRWRRRATPTAAFGPTTDTHSRSCAS